MDVDLDDETDEDAALIIQDRQVSAQMKKAALRKQIKDLAPELVALPYEAIVCAEMAIHNVRRGKPGMTVPLPTGPWPMPIEDITSIELVRRYNLHPLT